MQQKLWNGNGGTVNFFTEKVLASVLWDCQGVIKFDFLIKGRISRIISYILSFISPTYYYPVNEKEKVFQPSSAHCVIMLCVKQYVNQLHLLVQRKFF